MTALESLRSLSHYPIPDNTLQTITVIRGLNPQSLVESVCQSAAYRLCKADVLRWLSQAPNVSQEGVSFSFSAEERDRMSDTADSIYENPDGEDTNSPVWGYKASRL